MTAGSEDPFLTLFTGSITAKIGGAIKAIIDQPQREKYLLKIKVVDGIGGHIGAR